MNTQRVIYHLARADFLERIRRTSFLLMLGLVVWIGYLSASGQMGISLALHCYGIVISAWVGAVMTLTVSIMLSLVGFYLVKGSVSRDYTTGVGQIMATTPMSRPFYMLGKWISNFAVLMAMVVILVVFGIVIQFLNGESTQFNFAAYLSPFVFIVTPLMAVVAGVAVLFEAIPFLSGGFGNVVYFFAFVMIIPFTMDSEIIKTNRPQIWHVCRGGMMVCKPR